MPGTVLDAGDTAKRVPELMDCVFPLKIQTTSREIFSMSGGEGCSGQHKARKGGQRKPE